MRPSKIEWVIAIILFLFLFASWGHGDTKNIVGYEIDFADSIVHGEYAHFWYIKYAVSLKLMRINRNGQPLYFSLRQWLLIPYAL